MNNIKSMPILRHPLVSVFEGDDLYIPGMQYEL